MSSIKTGSSSVIEQPAFSYQLNNASSEGCTNSREGNSLKKMQLKNVFHFYEQMNLTRNTFKAEISELYQKI